ncbi:branched-chain amino acid aminotransferase [Polynucleobacter paneuropaeus]|jgi:branched-chain amino acid aminotransferase|uniref:aminotransferase class IV n=1 Tax=Polynucleobacter paneuropaeus TaxID=2527775 RepID=UPI001BFD5080|nr:aminotransferase class IV [Polynucleobacter paneuropaeus]MBT8633191.1 branched-chain amino acid aminotransferase [Polynucleobacter paneuropaeus]
MTSSTRLVYFNGKLVPENEAKISIYDSALMFGDMVFEMTRSFNKEQFKLREHIDRLYAGLKILRIPLHMTPEEMELACYQTIEANDHLFESDDEHRLMIDVSRGLLGIYHGIEGLHHGPNIIIADFPLRWTVANMGPLFDTGINAVITSQRIIPASLLDPKIKNRSRIHYLMANIEASQIAGDNNWALLLDPDGFVAEGTGSNFFIVKNGAVITPEGRNMLRGVSRDYVIEVLCPQLNIPVIEKNIEPYDIYTADEAFMTGTPFCMLPVTSLNGTVIGTHKAGEIFTRLIKCWGGNTGVDIVQQIKSWNSAIVNTGNTAPTPYNFKSN